MSQKNRNMQGLLQRAKLSLLYRNLLDLQSSAVPSLLLQEPVSLPAAAWRHWLAQQAGISSQASNAESSKIACLNGVRGVLHLGGEDVYHFLNVRRMHEKIFSNAIDAHSVNA